MKTRQDVSHILSMAHVIWLVLPFLLAIAQIYLYSLHTKLQIIDAFLIQYLWIGVGVQAILAGISQTFFGEKSAAYLNWPYSPFVHELGYANLAFGILGLLCPLIKGTWWAATGIGYAIFLLCTTAGHIYNILGHKNLSFKNMGPTIWSDILIPFILLMLISWHYGTVMQAYLR